ncbi:MAG TPA: VOC family protein [Caulobacteraceae bacterium]
MAETQTPTMPGGVIAHLNPSDASAAAEFYKRAFGAVELSRIPAQDGKRLMHCHLAINGGALLLADNFPESGYPTLAPQGFSLLMMTDDVDAAYQRAIDAGATSVMAPQQMFWGDRYAQVTDPFGYLWSLDQAAAQ